MNHVMQLCLFAVVTSVLATFEYEVINERAANARRASADNSFHSILSVCDNISHVCQDGQCCPTNQEEKPLFGCCPFKKGKCCAQLGRCCGPGYKCTDASTLKWITHIFGEAFAENFHCIIDYSLFQNIFTSSTALFA